MKLLLLQDCYIPALKDIRNEDLFFDKTDFSLDDIYNCLSHFNNIEEEAQQFIHEQVVKLGL